jgi:cell division protein FtsB
MFEYNRRGDRTGAPGRPRSNTEGGRKPEGSRQETPDRNSAQRPGDKGRRAATQAGANRAEPAARGKRAEPGARGKRAAPAEATALRGPGTGAASARGSSQGRSSAAQKDRSTTGKRAGGRHRDARRRSVTAKIAGITPRTVILLILLVMFIVLSVSPVTRNLEATGHLNRMQAELKKEKAVTESLEKEVKEAGSADYVTKEARKQHMVAPGEIPYLVTTDQPEGEIQYRVKALQSMEEAWARVRQMLHSVPRQQ